MELREALEAATAEQEKVNEVQVQEPATESAPAVEPEQQTPAEVSEAGDDSAAVVEPAEPQKKPDETESAPAPTKTDETLAQRIQHRVDRAPASWRKDAKGEWAALPLHVRQEVYKREMEVEKVLKDAAPMREQLQ